MKSGWIKTAEDLAGRIANENEAGRIALQPKLAAVLRRMEGAGEDIPTRLRMLDEALTSEVVEACFDNVPV